MVFSSLELEKRLAQTKVYYERAFLFCLKRDTHRPSKVVPLSPVCFIGTTCFDECFLFHVITRRHYLLYEFIVTLSFFNHYVVTFFVTSALKQYQLLHCYYQSSKINLFLNWFDNVFYTLSIRECTIFFMRFFKKTPWKQIKSILIHEY